MESHTLYASPLLIQVGTAFAVNRGGEKDPNVILANEHYNTNIHVEKTKIKRTELYNTSLDSKNDNLNGESSDSFQGLIMSPSVIMKVFAENPSIVSS